MKLKLFSLSLLLMVSSALAGEINGTVYLLKDKKKVPLSKVPMRMHVYKDDYEFSGAEISTDASGRYRFHNLETDSRYAYLFYPIYQGINYPYQEIVFVKGKTSEKADFELTESTGSTKDISVNETMYFDFGKKDVWKVTHVISVENKGEFLYHADRPDAEPLLFPLFEGGFDLSYLDGISRENSKIDDEKDVLQTYLTIPAHQTYKIKFSYYYIPTSRHVTFDRSAALARSNVSLLLGKNIRVVSNQFQLDPMLVKTQPPYVRAYTSGPIEQNGKISFELKGFFLQRDLLHMIVLALCMAFAVVMLFVAFGMQKPQKKDKELTERMHRYLMDLRQQFKEGKIDEQHFKKEEQRVLNYLFQMSKQS